ncbi:MAG: LysR family transcriptional regulator [Polaromonas sp.]|nr:LysR family transcriptional regulator [Polaromonas sp.]
MKTIDTRLLQVFNEIYAKKSVSNAALALGLPQPAVSIALAKLREHFANPLFVRTTDGMVPTPLGAELIEPVRAALNAVSAVVDFSTHFDPSTSKRVFKIAMTDISQLILLPKLWESLRLTAPGVGIDVFPLSSDTPQLLESGAVDLALGYVPELEAGFYQQRLFSQHFVCMVSQSHPRIQGKLKLKQYLQEDHAAIVSSGAAPKIIDETLHAMGKERRIALRIPHFLGASFVVELTDLLITIPQRLAEVLQGRGAYVIYPVPFAIPTYEVKQHWHERYHHDAASRWLRGVIADLLTDA